MSGPVRRSSRPWRRLLLLGAVAVVVWRVLRAVWLVTSALLVNRPQRIGNWFRIAEDRHREVYRDPRRYEIERRRAEEEGWRLASERQTVEGVVVIYERVEPALGAESGDRSEVAT